MDSISIELAQICRAFFILATAATITANSIPQLRRAWVVYGSRKSKATSPQHCAKGQSQSLWDYAGGFQVPHSWFTSFYITSVASSIFWAFQIATQGVVFRSLATHGTQLGGTQARMTTNQVVITWAIMALQGTRRLYESISLSKPSEAKMPILAWAVGIAFYLGVGLSVWVEGAPSLLEDHFNGVAFIKPSLKTLLAIFLYFLASGIQHDCHKYLASLKKYSLPERGAFQWVLCPHYTCDCVIYLSLATVAAPDGQVLNKTISTVLLFTIVNLGITAESSRGWYAEKFGAEKIVGRWRMVPFVY